MKVKLIIIIFFATVLSGGGYYYYQHNYVDTLMLSEIIGKTDNNLLNIGLNLFDFDTGLTRNDINHLDSNKEYWINRLNELDSIKDPDAKAQANLQLISDMMEEPALKKIVKIVTTNGIGIVIKLMEAL
jgi:hypothetical protein